MKNKISIVLYLLTFKVLRFCKFTIQNYIYISITKPSLSNRKLVERFHLSNWGLKCTLVKCVVFAHILHIEQEEEVAKNKNTPSIVK